MIVERLAAGAVIAAALALTARRVRALTWSGVAAAIAVGSISFAFGGLVVAAAIVIFFLSGSVLGRIRKRERQSPSDLGVKGAQRDAAQVLANGALATACAFIGGLATMRSWPHANAWIAASVGAIAAASGDTWSTEIGGLSRAAPRRIIDGCVVEAGASGAVTWLGTFAAPLGGIVISLAWLAGSDAVHLTGLIGVGALAGLAGSLLDSWLGASAQAVWRCPTCGRLRETRGHEACGVDGELIHGLAWLDNDVVNAVATLAGALIGFCAALTFG